MTIADTPIYSSLAARLEDPPTSHAAAPPISKVRLIQQRILAILEQHGPITHEEIRDWYLLAHGYGRGSSPTSIRTRTNELWRAGGVRAVDRDGTTAAGYPATRWDIYREGNTHG